MLAVRKEIRVIVQLRLCMFDLTPLPVGLIGEKTPKLVRYGKVRFGLVWFG